MQGLGNRARGLAMTAVTARKAASAVRVTRRLPQRAAAHPAAGMATIVAAPCSR